LTPKILKKKGFSTPIEFDYASKTPGSKIGLKKFEKNAVVSPK
jgi:hypothetical protein